MIAFLELYVSSFWAWLGITVLAWIIGITIMGVIETIANALTRRGAR